MVAAFDSREVGAADGVVHDDYLDHQGLPHDRPIRGVSGFVHVVEAARSGYVDLSVEIVDLIEGDDRAAARLVCQARARPAKRPVGRPLRSSGSGRERQSALGRALMTVLAP